MILLPTIVLVLLLNEKYYGYNPKIINLYEQGYELATKINDIRGIMYITIEKVDLMLKNTSNIEKLDEILDEMLLFLKEYKEEPHYKSDIQRMMAFLLKQLNLLKHQNYWL